MAATSSGGSVYSVVELTPFVPRLTLDWLRDGGERKWREVEGTLSFVDISGFTAMSEKLSSLGKPGAEEVTDVMNATFAALLEIAYGYGGGLLKFGGDALLLFYSGENHARRATRAAFGMRRRLKTIGRPRTSAGVVTLRMHVGLHSDDFQFFLVGDTHRELLVTGPAATRTVEMEATSEAGDILLSPETAAFLDEAQLGEWKGDGILLAAEPQADGHVEPLPDVTDIPLEVAVPAPLRAQLLEVGPLEGEHRAVGIAFVRFSGIDELVDNEGPEGAASALDEVVGRIQRAASDHEVTFLESDVDRDGGRIILVSGAPQTAGDDEERLLRTVRAVVQEDSPLPLHVGVSRGRVFTGQVGASFRRTYTVLGDTAALAARLMARAAPNQILVSDAVLERSQARFEVAPLEPFLVKGKSEPVHASALGDLLGDRVERRERELPFVDRERERAVLSASVAPVRMGFGTLVELVGEAGIGKSRLTDELRQQCADMTALTARCEQYESSTPYHTFKPLLRSLLGLELNGDGAHNRELLTRRIAEIDGELVPWTPLLAAPLDIDVESTPEVDELDPAFRRARLHGVVGSLLGKLVDGATLFVLEDVHWMDEASSDLFRHLGTQLPTRPWLACTTRRPVAGGFVAAEGTPPLPAMTLRLEPLPEADAKTLVAAAAAELGLTEEELAVIAERGGGNPLFLQELASAGRQAEDAEDLPETVEALLTTRIDALAPADRALLRWASVLGASFSAADIAAVLEGDPSAAGDSEAWDRLAEFVERDPAVPGAFRFRHALIRDAAYEGLSYRRRRDLHGRVADVIEARLGDDAVDAAEILSLHFERAGRAPETWRYACEAGRRARDKWANREAVDFYRRALDVARSVDGLEPGEVATVWESLGDALQLLSEYEEASRAYATARKVAPDDAAEQVALMYKEGTLRRNWGRYTDAIRWYSRGLKATEALEDEELRTRFRLDFRMGYAQVRFRQGEFRDCIRRCNDVIAEALQVGDNKTLAPAYLVLHLVYTLLGSSERDAFRGLSLPLYEELGDLNGQADALINLGVEAYYVGDWAKARDLYDRSRRLRERIGDVVRAAMATNNIAEILSDQGHLEEAERLFEEVAATCDQAGERLLSTLARANLGRIAARAGRFDEAATVLADAAEAFRSIHATNFLLETEARLAELATLRGGAAGDALAIVDSVLERVEDDAGVAALNAALYRVRAVALWQSGDTDGARDAVTAAIDAARAGEAIYELALALDTAAAFEGGDGAAAAESGDLLERLGVEEVARPPLS